jgi:hypothetical protein
MLDIFDVGCPRIILMIDLQRHSIDPRAAAMLTSRTDARILFRRSKSSARTDNEAVLLAKGWVFLALPRIK